MSDSETTAAAEQAAEEAAARRGRARRVWLTRLGVVVAIAGVLWLGGYLIVGRSHVSTDDAYVDADMAQITPLMSASAATAVAAMIVVPIRAARPPKAAPPCSTRRRDKAPRGPR